MNILRKHHKNNVYNTPFVTLDSFSVGFGGTSFAVGGTARGTGTGGRGAGCRSTTHDCTQPASIHHHHQHNQLKYNSCFWLYNTLLTTSFQLQSNTEGTFHLVSWSRCTLPCSGGAIWWMLTKWMQAGSFHSWINLWVAGTTVWSLVNTCHS